MSAVSIDAEKLSQLKKFIDLCENNPSLLYLPELDFFRKFLRSLGAQIPEKANSSGDHSPKQAPPEEESASEEDEDLEEEVKEEEIEESDVELDTSLVVEVDVDDPLPVGDDSIEVTDEMLEESGDKRGQAQEALSEGKLEEAVSLFTEAIMKNPQGAALYAKRASVLLKLEKPLAALRDCDKALLLNPDSALAYKFRGRAKTLLGQWEEAAADLALACRIDYTDEANDWLKVVMPNAKKIQDHKRKYERIKKDKEIKERMERIKKAKEQAERDKNESWGGMPGGAGAGGFPGGAGGMPNMAGIQELLKDPEVIQAFQDPVVAAAFQDITMNPANLSKYQDNPKVAALLTKLASKMGGGVPGAGFPSF